MGGYTCSMTTTQDSEAKARTDAEFLAGYDQHQADAAAALLASLPGRRARTRKAAK